MTNETKNCCSPKVAAAVAILHPEDAQSIGICGKLHLRVQMPRFLLQKRHPDCMFSPLKWNFPGGKVKYKEPLEVAAMREVEEESGLAVELIQLLSVHEAIFEEHWIIFQYLASAQDASASCADGEAIACRWATIPEAEQMDLCPSSRALMPYLRGIEASYALELPEPQERLASPSCGLNRSPSP